MSTEHIVVGASVVGTASFGAWLLLWGLVLAKPRPSYTGGQEPSRIFRARRVLMVFEGFAFSVVALAESLIFLGVVPLTDATVLFFIGVGLAALIAPLPMSLIFPGIMGNRY